MKNALCLLTLAALAVPFAPACTSDNTGSTHEVVVEPRPEKESSTISVTGQGTASAKPDILSIDVGVSVLRKSVSDAMAVASRQADAVMDALLKNDISKDDIQTTDYSIAPEYSWNDDTQTLDGYRVTNLMRVRLRALDRAGQVLDAVAAAGGDDVRIQNLEFTLDDPDEVREKARQEAWKDAEDRASQLARLAGETLGDPRSIEEASDWTAPTPFYAAEVASAKSTPIESGQLEVTVTVDVKFALEEHARR